MVVLREKKSGERKNAAFPSKTYMDICSFKLSTWNLNMDCILDDSAELTLNFLVIIMVLFLYRIPLILRRCMMTYIGINDTM